ncbi:MAG: M15 family metallopeptidase [Enterocloster sp.]
MGTAFDIFRNDGAGAYNDSALFFQRVGAIGMSLGLEWGGNWKSIMDNPHFQLPDWGSSTSGIKRYTPLRRRS